MQDFLAAETGALGDSLREAEAELARANQDLERRLLHTDYIHTRNVYIQTYSSTGTSRDLSAVIL